MRETKMVGLVLAAALSAGAAQAEFIFKDSMTSDSGWVGADAKLDFTKLGMNTTGIVSREIKWFPDAFDARVTIDAKEAVLWAFGVAGTYDAKSGFSGIAIVADRQEKPGFTLGRWENDSLIDSMWVDAGKNDIFNGVHDIDISVREGYAWANIDGETVAKIGFESNPKGTQIVIASYSDSETFFRDVGVLLIPSAGTLTAFAPMVLLLAARRRRSAA